MANSGFLGISLLAYASWQTLHFLSERGHRVWAKQRYYKYLPRPSAENLKSGKSCRSCVFFDEHPDFKNAGNCSHPGWEAAMNSDVVMVKKAGSCELWCKISPRQDQDRALPPDLFPLSESAFEFPLH